MLKLYGLKLYQVPNIGGGFIFVETGLKSQRYWTLRIKTVFPPFYLFEFNLRNYFQLLNYIWSKGQEKTTVLRDCHIKCPDFFSNGKQEYKLLIFFFIAHFSKAQTWFILHSSPPAAITLKPSHTEFERSLQLSTHQRT